MPSDNPFKIRFARRFEEALRIFGLDKHRIIKEEYIEKDDPLRNAVDIITGNIGREWGLSTRIRTLEKAGLTDESPLEDKMKELRTRFKEHMKLHDVLISYGGVSEDNVLIVKINGCIFKNNDLIPHEGYSIGFVQGYFGANKVMNSYTLCDKSEEECKGKNCQVWIEY